MKIEKVRKHIKYNTCPWCEDETLERHQCRKTLGHAQFQVRVAWLDFKFEFKKLFKPLTKLFR